MLTLFLACGPDPADTGGPQETGQQDSSPPPSACDCAVRDDVPFVVSEMGGFDDWSGAAMAWAVDATHDRVLVAGMRYPLGTSSIPLDLSCENPDALAASWVQGVPSSATDATRRYPLLASALTTAPGVRSLSDELGALLLEGDLAEVLPTRVRVSTGGQVTLLRLEAQDQLQGAFEFAAEGDVVGDGADVGCGESIRVAGLALAWLSSGTE